MEARKYNFFAVECQIADNDDCLLRLIIGNAIGYRYWQPGEQSKPATAPIGELKWESLSVRQTFRSIEITYETVLGAYLASYFPAYPWLKWRIAKLRRKRPPLYSDRMELLRLVVTQWRTQGFIEMDRLLQETYGTSAFRDYNRHWCENDLQYLLRSLRFTKDVDFDDGCPDLIEPTAQALDTLGKFEVEQSRARDNLRIARLQVVISILLLAATVALAAVGVLDYLNHPIPESSAIH